jgi:hypothetical protein
LIPTPKHPNAFGIIIYMKLRPIFLLDNALSRSCLLRIYSLFTLTFIFCTACYSQMRVYDEQSEFAVKALLRSKGVRVEAEEGCQADLFQLSKRILEGLDIDHLRFSSEDRFVAVEGMDDVKVVIYSRDWMRESTGTIIHSEIFMRDSPVMLSIRYNNHIEVLPDKLEISKQ